VIELADNFWTTLPLGRDVAILTRDENGLVALNKPAGVLSHPNERADEARSLLTVRYDAEEECYVWRVPAPDGREAPSERRLWLLNRLDSATSGAILAAADGALALAVRGQFKQRRIAKLYAALVFGKPRQPTELWHDVLDIVKTGSHIRTSAGTGKTHAESRMRVVRSRVGAMPLALIKLEPKTGRSHQLRVQCAKRQLPIVGDQTYGDFASNREFARKTGYKRLFLHSLETKFEYEWQGKRHAFAAAAPLPAEFEKPLHM